MAATEERQVRISRIAGRYLVFDIDDVVHMRRRHGICAVLTGTMPQNPTQNLFLGLPVELQAEEAKLLVEKGAGYIADELADHLSQLSAATSESARAAYRQHLKQQRRTAQQVFEEEKAKVQAKHRDKRKAKTPAAAAADSDASGPGLSSAVTESPSLFDSPAPHAQAEKPLSQSRKEPALPAVTPTTSFPLVATGPNPANNSVPPAAAPAYPLCKYLNARGYYTTPGLRFGGDLSVYPGDPFRYHAHYLANSYGWDEEVAMLDLVTSGRLGTAVKKGFLFGAEKPAVEGQDGEGEGEGEVRVFCVEWAGM